MALCAGVMTLCAASSLFVSCDKYDDTALRNEIAGLKGELSGLDARVKAIEDLKTALTTLTARVDALYTLSFQVTDSNELQYSFDGNTWVPTGVILAEDCEKPEVSLVETDESVTITVGDKSFTIEKPEEIVFDIRAGKVYFASEETKEVAIKTVGIEDLTVIATPMGWEVELTDGGNLVVTAPNEEDAEEGYIWDENDNLIELIPTAVLEGYIKIHACTADGKCVVGKVAVEVVSSPIVITTTMDKYTIVAPRASEYNEVFFGISPRETYKADMKSFQDLFMAEYELSGGSPEWDNVITDGSVPTTGTIESLLGSKPVIGEDYVIWAASWSMAAYDTIDDYVIAFYTPYEVVVKEDETKRSAYDVFVSIDVNGVDKYLATVALTGGRYPSADMMIEETLYELAEGMELSYFQLHTEGYNNSLYKINDKTTARAEGLAQPGQKATLIVLPLDGRPYRQYTAEDFLTYPFETNALAAGGSVNASVTTLDTYLYDGVVTPVNPYTDIALKLNASAESWKYMYVTWMPSTELDKHMTDGAVTDMAKLINAAMNFESASCISKDDPYFTYELPYTGMAPGESISLVAFFVDENDKYGDVVAGTYKTKELKAVTFENWAPATNVEGTVLGVNKLVVENLTSTTPIAKYRYFLNKNTSAYAYYDDNMWIEYMTLLNNYTISEHIEEFTPSADWDGKITADLNFGTTYYLVVVPYDADSNPGTPYRLKFDCKLAELTSVETTNLQGEPVVTFIEPEYSTTNSPDNDEKGYYYFSMRNGNVNSISYKVRFDVTPAANSDVVVAIVNSTASTVKGKTPEQIATSLWNAKITGSVALKASATPEKLTTDLITLNDTAKAGLTPNIYVTWKVGETYYYKTISLETQFAAYHAKLKEEIAKATTPAQ